MPLAELVVGHGKPAGCKILVVWLTCTLDIASTPAGVNEFPCHTVNAYGIPGVAAHVFSWKWIAWTKSFKTESFSMPTNNHTLQSCRSGQRSEQSSIAFAHS